MKNINWDKKIHHFLLFLQIVFYLVATFNSYLQIKNIFKNDGSTGIETHLVSESASVRR